MESVPEISVIIPILQEAAVLPSLLDRLAQQRDVALEIILSDGGSQDGSAAIAERTASTIAAPVTFVTGKPGRGAQLNRGAARSRGEFLLFVHADSFFPDASALRNAIDFLKAEATGRAAAGKFRLGFERSGGAHPFGYYYHECKARLLRRECTHGDQGLLMPRRTFAAFGPYDDALPMLAETRMADRLLNDDRLCLLPADIRTSARRFETEGLRERQTLNAIIMNFAALGWQPFFAAFPEIYPRQEQAGALPLRQVLQQVARLLRTVPLRERISLWRHTGEYVRSNAWQIPFACDCFRNFRSGVAPGVGENRLLHLHDFRVGGLTENAVATLLAALLVRSWFLLAAHR